MKGAFIGCKGVYEKQEHPIIFMSQKITVKPAVQVAPINSPFTLDFIVYMELYSGTELFNTNLDDLNIVQFSVYKNGEWVIATRSDGSNDNFAMLDFVEDDGTGGIVPSHDIEKILG